MYSIGEIAKLTGITAFTLRYYEKAGVLPKPRRQDGQRSYDEQDLQYIRFINGLKETGMSLENIAAFTEDGCILTRNDSDMDNREILYKRINMLDEHIGLLDEKIKRLEVVNAVALEKRALYSVMLRERT